MRAFSWFAFSMLYAFIAVFALAFGQHNVTFAVTCATLGSAYFGYKFITAEVAS